MAKYTSFLLKTTIILISLTFIIRYFSPQIGRENLSPDNGVIILELGK